MYQKATDTLRILLLTGIFFMMGLFVFAFYDNQEKSIFDLQQEYTQNIQKQLNNLLEPLVGAGNVKTSAQVRLQQTDQTTVSKKWYSPTQQTTTTIRYQGSSLKSQHISVLLNKTKNIQENDISELVKSALGINTQLGDTLSVRILPFVKVPLLSFGLARLTLARIGAVLVLFLAFLTALLFYLYKKSELIHQMPRPKPNEALWQRALKISPVRLSVALNSASPEVSAFILYRLPDTLSAQITNLLPSEYMAQVMIHMTHLENLTPQAYKNLLYASEMCLMHLTEKKVVPDANEKVADILAKSIHKNNVLNTMNQQNKQAVQQMQMETLTFEKLKDWSDKDFQTLMHYISKKLAIPALQTAPLEIHRRFAENLPPAVWIELSDTCRQNLYSLAESQRAQQEIVAIAKNLIINNLVDKTCLS